MHFSEYDKIEELENEHFWYKAMEEFLLDYFEKPGKRKLKILDAGCGTGGFSEKLGQYGKVTAIDVNKTALTHAKKKNISLVTKATVENLPFKTNSFDYVTCLDVLYHRGVTDDTKALGEIYRVLKPGGMLILRLPALESLRGKHDIIVETRHRYSVREVREKLINEDFKIIKLGYANFLLSIPMFIKRQTEKMLKSQTPVSDSIRLPKPVNTIFYGILKADLRLFNQINYPFGSSILAFAQK